MLWQMRFVMPLKQMRHFVCWFDMDRILQFSNRLRCQDG